MKSLFVAVPLAALSVVSACSVDDETQITVALQSETEIPKELDNFTVRVTTTRTNEVRYQQDYPANDGTQFPTTLAVIPADDDSLKSPLRVEIIGTLNGQTVLSRTSVASYVKGRNLLLAMPLRMACFQAAPCAVGQTCRGGQCVAEEVPADQLIDYQAQYIVPDSAGCFDEEKCLAAKSEVTIATDCTFPIASGDPVNVAIRWQAAPNRLLALDSNDTQEGWTRLAANQGKLSQGACDSHFQKKGAGGVPLVSDFAKQIYVTTGCQAKTSTVPYCRSTATRHAGIGAISPE